MARSTRIELTEDQMHSARSWIRDCVWSDLESEDVAELTDEEIITGINRHWVGGLADFVKVEV